MTSRAVNDPEDDLLEDDPGIYLSLLRERDEAVKAAGRLRDNNRRLRIALRQILEDPDAQILDSHRDDGWAALGK